MIKVEIRLADGAYHEFAGDPELYNKLLALQAGGFQGKELIDQLLANDWSAPPTVVTIYGTDPAGKSFRHFIPYS